jgi:hypothetical protein
MYLKWIMAIILFTQIIELFGMITHGHAIEYRVTRVIK